MRLPFLWLCGAGCGYGSYYPSSSLRNGQLVEEALTGDWPCSDPAGASQGPIVSLSVAATQDVLLSYVAPDCSEEPILALTSGQGTTLSAHPLSVFYVYDNSNGTLGGALSWFEVPVDSGGSWSETLP
jgi:hypothetical protein